MLPEDERKPLGVAEDDFEGVARELDPDDGRAAADSGGRVRSASSGARRVASASSNEEVWHRGHTARASSRVAPQSGQEGTDAL
jgi:hypothetical protein